MGTLRDKIDEIERLGNVLRGRWQPSLTSWHYARYVQQVWRDGRRISQENFCHYCQVVVKSMMPAIVRALIFSVIMALLIMVIFIAANNPVDFGQIVFEAAVLAGSIAYLVLGVAVSIYLFTLEEKDDGDFFPASHRWGWLERQSSIVKAPILTVTLPFVFLMTFLATIVFSIFGSLLFLEDEFDFYTRFGRWLTRGNLGEGGLLPWIRPWMLFPSALVIAAFWWHWAFVTAVLILAVAVGLLVIGAAFFLLDVLLEHRKAARVKWAEMKSSVVPDPDLEERQPSVITESFALVWAFVVAKKKRICPLVDLPTTRTDANSDV
jgi:hypothetical protein